MDPRNIRSSLLGAPIAIPTDRSVVAGTSAMGGLEQGEHIEGCVAAKRRTESSVELARRYRRELQDLVDLGEISPATAQRVLDDLLEPERPGKARRVRLPIWMEHCEEAEREASRRTSAGALTKGAKQLVERITALLR